MTDNLIKLIPVTEVNFLAYRSIINASIQNYYERSFYYHMEGMPDSYQSLVEYLQSNFIVLVQKNNKIIGFYNILHNTEDLSVSYTVFLHPQACKMGVLTLMNEGLDYILKDLLSYDVLVVLVHHSMLLSTIKNRFKEYSMARITDNFIAFSTKLKKENIIITQDS